MKKIFLLSILLFAISVSAQTTDVGKIPTIQVTGTAEIQVVPDIATFSFTVSKTNKSVSTAKRENDEIVAKVTDLAKRFGIAQTDVKTDYIRVSEATKRVKIPGSDDDYEEVFDGFRVNRSLVIKLRDMNKFETVLTAFLDAGINDVADVTFSSSEIRKHKDQARSQAIKAAREKAQSIALAINQSIGKAVSIEEKDIDGYRSPSANFTSNSFSLAENITENSAVGTIDVKAQVEVEFILN